MALGLNRDIRPASPPRRPGAAIGWLLQVVSGALLLVLLGVHIVAQHFIVSGGLRDYAQVVSYLANPAVVAIECAFVLVLIVHAMLGLRAVLLDFGFGPRARALITRAVIALGIVTAGYSFWLIAALASKS